jgi:hypothetical protein
VVTRTVDARGSTLTLGRDFLPKEMTMENKWHGRMNWIQRHTKRHTIGTILINATCTIIGMLVLIATISDDIARYIYLGWIVGVLWVSFFEIINILMTRPMYPGEGFDE